MSAYLDQPLRDLATVEYERWIKARTLAYRAGEYTMRVPDVTTGQWDIRAWCNWVRFNNPELNGYDNGRKPTSEDI